jgi:hypothetical protein
MLRGNSAVDMLKGNASGISPSASGRGFPRASVILACAQQREVVNGQVRVAAGGQVKVPIPRLFSVLGQASSCLGPCLSHPE